MTAVEVGSGSMFGSRVGIDGREPLLSMLRKASCRVTSYRLSPTCHPHSRHVFRGISSSIDSCVPRHESSHVRHTPSQRKSQPS